MNIALVIGVSKYSNPNSLPASKNDAETITAILKKTGKYDDILSLYNDENSAQTKTAITNFISLHKENTIDEFFFTTLDMVIF